MVKCINQ